MIYYLDLEIVKTKCHPETVKYFDKKRDPIASFDTADLGLLESALNQPQWHYYPTLEKKAAILLYGIIKNHPFENGNKRIAVVCLLTFLYINDRHLNVSDEELANTALDIARSDRRNRDIIINNTEGWIKQHLELFNENTGGN